MLNTNAAARRQQRNKHRGLFFSTQDDDNEDISQYQRPSNRYRSLYATVNTADDAFSQLLSVEEFGDVWLHIFSYLDVESLGNCAFVCTGWRKLVDGNIESEKRFQAAFLATTQHIALLDRGGWSEIIQQQIEKDENQMVDEDDEGSAASPVTPAPQTSLWRRRFLVHTWCLQRAREGLTRKITHLFQSDLDGRRSELRTDWTDSVFSDSQNAWTRSEQDLRVSAAFRSMLHWDDLDFEQRTALHQSMLHEALRFGEQPSSQQQIPSVPVAKTLIEYWEPNRLCLLGKIAGLDVEVSVCKAGPVSVRFDNPMDDVMESEAMPDGVAAQSALQLSFVDDTKFQRAATIK